MISVDTKKKELVGAYQNGGREWQPTGEPEQVKVHDFLDPTLGKANPYGVYDVGANIGWVSVGTDHDTAAFAVNTIATWWQQAGKHAAPRYFPNADLRRRRRLQRVPHPAMEDRTGQLAAATGLTITVCHLPPGTSKWTKVEHRLFSHISMNWRGRPLTSHEVIVETIAATTTNTGLTVHRTRPSDLPHRRQDPRPRDERP